MASPTPNKGYTYPLHGAAVNAWDTPLNTNFDYIDLNVGGPYPVTITSTAATITYNSSYAAVGSAATIITLPSSLAENLYYNYTGTMTNDQDLVFPAAGGLYVINNGSSGAFTLRAVVAGSTTVSVEIPQGGSNAVVSNGTDMVLANSNILAKVPTYLGDPNGNVAGTAATANGGVTDFEWDATNKNLYAATTTGTAATTVWTPVAAKLVPQGYLSVSADNSAPIITGDSASATTVKYLPYQGNWTLLSDGTTVYPYQFSPMTLTLTNSLSASTAYDLFMTWNAGTPVFGFGPAWSNSGTGTSARGTGAGTTQLSRLLGVWTNTVSMNLTYNTGGGNTTIVVAAGNAVYLGSILMDSAAGQVSCYRAWGQSRKFGLWNYFNRVPIVLQVGDSTATWSYASATIRAANATSANSAAIFTGMAEEEATATTAQVVSGNPSASADAEIGIGYNVTTAYSGMAGYGRVFQTGGPGALVLVISGQYTASPALGLNTFYMVESSPTGGGTVNFLGTNRYMQMTVSYRG